MSECTRCGEVSPAEIHTCTPLAMRLADAMESGKTLWPTLAVAAELRRLSAENDRLTAERDALVVDALRLDWLDMMAQPFGRPAPHRVECGYRWTIDGEVFNLRRAIDANMLTAAKAAREASA